MKRKLLISVAALAFVLCALLLCSCAGGALEPGDAIATVSGDTVTVSAAFTEQLQNAKRDQTVYLFAVDPDVKLSELLESSDPVALAEAKMAGSLSFNVPLCENGVSRLTSGFVFATYDKLQKIYEPLHDSPVYISKPEDLASYGGADYKNGSIKGMNAESASDVIALGASHALVDLPIEKYVLTEDNGNSIRHEFGGVSYYFDRTAVEALDKKVSSLSDFGAKVYLRIYLGVAIDELEDDMRFLACPGTEEGAEYYTIDFGDKKALLAYSAFTDLLCSRYAEGKADFGTAESIIVGKAANAPDLGSNVGHLKSGAYVEHYAKALRITHNILRSHCKSGQVYLSIDRNLCVSSLNTLISGEEFMLSIAEIAKDQGDYEWGVAAECSSFAGNDSVWIDTEDFAYLSPANLSALTNSVLERDELTYGDVIRDVIISDLYIYCDPEVPASESNQAASYAYAYYNAVKNGKVSALIYSYLNDGKNNPCGLKNENGEKKIYSMVRAIDTDTDLSDEVGNLIGRQWTSLYKNEDLRKAVVRGQFVKGSAKTGSTDKYDLSSVASFEGGTLAGFDTLGVGRVGLVREDGVSRLFAHFDPKTQSGGFAVKIADVPAELISGNYLVVPIKISADGDVATDDYRVTLTLIQKENGGEVRNYSASLSLASDAERTAIFDISKFTESKLSSAVTVMLTVESAEDVPFTLLIGEVLSASEHANNWWIIVLIILGALLIIGGITVFVLWFRKNYTLDLGSIKEALKFGKNKKSAEGEEE